MFQRAFAQVQVVAIIHHDFMRTSANCIFQKS